VLFVLLAVFVTFFFVADDELPVGPVPAAILVWCLLTLLAPHARRFAWIAEAPEGVPLAAVTPTEAQLVTAMREARTRRLVLLSQFLICLVLLLPSRIIEGIPRWQAWSLLALVLLALGRTLVDLRQLEKLSRESVRAPALRQAFS